MTFDEKLNKILARHKELANQLSQGVVDDAKEYAKMTKEFASLEDVCALINERYTLQENMKEAREILDTSDDKDMKELAEEEYYGAKEKLPELERRIKLSLLPKDEADENDVILEIRAGTGGAEACLFAADLYRMYQRYAEEKSWKFENMNLHEAELGGIKEACVSIGGKQAFGKLKFESGVHRVQRVPETEASGRIHTSAATVAVLPEAEDIDIEIEEKDLIIDTYRASGAGGQHVNTTDSAVRITHVPTGVVVAQQDERSQHKNRAKAMKILKARIYEAQRAKQHAELAAERKSQVGSGDRSERIRTYNFPQGRVTDHRINLTLYKLDRILDGIGLEEVIDALIYHDQAAKLGEL